LWGPYHQQVYVRFDGTLQQILQYQAELENLREKRVCRSLDTSPDTELLNDHVLNNFEIRSNERKHCEKNPKSDGAIWEKMSSSADSDSDSDSDSDYMGGQ